MKVYNDKIAGVKKSKLLEELKKYRKERNFDAKKYLDLKIDLLCKYFLEHKLDSAVIAISGGIDSALVLAIMNKFKARHPEVLKKILAITLPAVSNSGVTGQEELQGRVLELSNNLNIEIKNLDLSNFSNNINFSTELLLDVKINNWAKGQFIPYLRTSYLYFLTNILNQEGFRTVLVGTTNADEGQYLGYIGKASDGMVDLQIISDLHKSEVYKLSKLLNIPNSIINCTPTGDMFDNRNDEDVFGTTYDAVELYYHFLKMNKEDKDLFIKNMSNDELDDFKKIQHNLDNMHKYNLHKYIGYSPAVHFDLFNMKINNGWKYYNYKIE